MVKQSLLKCINSNVILMIHNTQFGQCKNTLHNVVPQGVWLIRQKGTQSTTKSAVN